MRAAAKASKSTDSTRRWLESWWTQKYKLPPNHTLFTKRSPGALFREMLEDYAQQRGDILEALRTNTGDRPRLMEALAIVDRVLGEELPDAPLVTGDPVVDEWERELAEGRIPESLTKGIVKSRSGAQNVFDVMKKR